MPRETKAQSGRPRERDKGPNSFCSSRQRRTHGGETKAFPPLWRPFLECPLLVGECSMHIRPVSKRGWNDADDEGQRDRASRKISETKRRERAAARPSVTKEQQRDQASRKSSSETERRERAAAARPNVAKEQQRDRVLRKSSSETERRERAAAKPSVAKESSSETETASDPRAHDGCTKSRMVVPKVQKPHGGRRPAGARSAKPARGAEAQGQQGPETRPESQKAVCK
jgi:hypothetical protein